MIQRYLPHGKVVNVCGGERSSDPFCCRRDQAIRLVQRHALLREGAPPGARLDTLRDTKWGQTQCIEQTTGSSLLARP